MMLYRPGFWGNPGATTITYAEDCGARLLTLWGCIREELSSTWDLGK